MALRSRSSDVAMAGTGKGRRPTIGAFTSPRQTIPSERRLGAHKLLPSPFLSGPKPMMRRSFIVLALACQAAIPLGAQTSVTPNQAEAREIFQELIEINSS